MNGFYSFLHHPYRFYHVFPTFMRSSFDCLLDYYYEFMVKTAVQNRLRSKSLYIILHVAKYMTLLSVWTTVTMHVKCQHLHLLELFRHLLPGFLDHLRHMSTAQFPCSFSKKLTVMRVHVVKSDLSLHSTLRSIKAISNMNILCIER